MGLIILWLLKAKICTKMHKKDTFSSTTNRAGKATVKNLRIQHKTSHHHMIWNKVKRINSQQQYVNKERNSPSPNIRTMRNWFLTTYYLLIPSQLTNKYHLTLTKTKSWINNSQLNPTQSMNSKNNSRPATNRVISKRRSAKPAATK